MPKIRELKKRGRVNLKKHFWTFFFICLFVAFFGAEYSSSISSMHDSSNENTNSFAPSTDYGLHKIITDFLSNQINMATKDARLYITEKKRLESEYIGNTNLKKINTIFVGLINDISSGNILNTLFSAIKSFIGSKSVWEAVLIAVALAISLLFWSFFTNFLRVLLRRIVLEGRLYNSIPIERIVTLPRKKKWIKGSLTMLLTYLYQLLWDLTIIGGIIKRYSYFMVPYIVAETPTIDAKKAIKLSKDMMYGHKLECFLLEISYAGWWVLNLITFGLSGLFYSNGFQQATYCEYFVEIRKLAKENNIEGIELLSDHFLYEYPDDELLQRTYPEYSTLLDNPVSMPPKKTGIAGFFAKNFGIVFSRKSELGQLEYDEYIYNVTTTSMVFEKKIYPQRLIPNYTSSKATNFCHLRFHKCYSVFSLTLMFFICSFVGWLWEVSLHLIEDGQFINRGVNHGPWLPIYGSGVILFLTLLYRFRKKPVYEFFLGLLICGIVEYLTGTYLEFANNGQKWWDYSGYYLNLNGRICAEGLIVFGIGGMIVVYLATPIIDSLLNKIKEKILIFASIALLFIFSIDLIYSHSCPNVGVGITTKAAYMKHLTNADNKERTKQC